LPFPVDAAPLAGKSFDIPWPLLLFVVDLPMVLYYGFFLPLMGCVPHGLWRPRNDPALRKLACVRGRPMLPHSAVDHHPLLHSCIYNSTLWIVADFAAALWYMLAMLVLLYILRDVRAKCASSALRSGQLLSAACSSTTAWLRPYQQVKDDLGENESVRRALLFSFGLWAITLAVQVFGWDHLW